jgi:hypothetical protein
LGYLCREASYQTVRLSEFSCLSASTAPQAMRS